MIICELYLRGMSGLAISKKTNIYPKKIYQILKSNNIILKDRVKKNTKYQVKEDFFDKIDDEKKAYFLGFLYADGCNTRSVIVLKLSEQDKNLLQQLNRLINLNRPLRYITNIKCIDKKGVVHDCHNAYELTIGSKKVIKQLTLLGLVPAKTNKIRFPIWLDKSLWKHFLRGYFDGDGWIGIHIPKFRKQEVYSVGFCSKNYNFANDIIDILNQYNIKSNIRQDGNIWKVEFLSYDSKKQFLDFIYQDSLIQLQRKYERYLQFLNRYFQWKEQRTSIYRGVSFIYKTQKWQARKYINKKLVSLGHFATEDEAYQSILKMCNKK